jgi:hypothetical protein
MLTLSSIVLHEDLFLVFEVLKFAETDGRTIMPLWRSKQDRCCNFLTSWQPVTSLGLEEGALCPELTADNCHRSDVPASFIN